MPLFQKKPKTAPKPTRERTLEERASDALTGAASATNFAVHAAKALSSSADQLAAVSREAFEEAQRLSAISSETSLASDRTEERAEAIRSVVA